MSVIDIQQLSFSYELGGSSLKVLDQVDLRLESGETAAILGPSGSGKTSLLLLLAGLEQPDQGSIVFENRNIVELNGDELSDVRRDHVGIIFQSFHLIPSLTALANVMLPLQIKQQADARAIASSLLERVGLGDRGTHYPPQLSGGEQQRVAIARALVHKPRLVLADEPTGNLDVDTGSQIVDLLFELSHETGSSMLLVTHDETIALRCGRRLRLDHGKLIEA